MADSPRHPDLSSNPGAGSGEQPGPEATTAAPRWVKTFAIVAVILVVLVVVMLLVGGGDHGPGRHMGSGDAAGQASPAEGVEESEAPVHAAPAGGHAP